MRWPMLAGFTPAPSIGTSRGSSTRLAPVSCCILLLIKGTLGTSCIWGSSCTRLRGFLKRLGV
eukprot:8845049-Pyramimonas_sp.AAC.1